MGVWLCSNRSNTYGVTIVFNNIAGHISSGVFEKDRSRERKVIRVIVELLYQRIVIIPGLSKSILADVL